MAARRDREWDLPEKLRGFRVRSVLAPGRFTAWVAVGLVLVAAVAGGDVALGSATVLAGALAFVTLLVAVAGQRGDTMVVAAAAVLASVLSGAWNGWGGAAYGISVAIVAAVGVIALLVGLLRASAAATARQLRLLRELLRMSDAAADVQATVDRLLDVVVPEFADVCGLDLVVEGELRRLGARVTGPSSEAVEAAMLRRRPRAVGAAGGAMRSIISSEPVIDEGVDDAALREVAASEQDLEALRSLAMGSAMSLPLIARGTTVGALSLAMGHSGRRYRPADMDFAELVAGRVAVVLDAAGLTREVMEAERRLAAALDSLDEAVTMNGPDGRTVYANQAAVELLKAPSAQALYASAPGEISARFLLRDEQGEPVPVDRLPAFRALRGETEPEPLLVRNVVVETGEERWLLNKVSVLPAPGGGVGRVVNVIEDVTEVKQAELYQRLLSEASRVLSSSLDYAETLQSVAEISVPELADWCGVDLPGEDGAIDAVALAHSDPQKVAVGRELRERYPVRMDLPTGLPRVIAEGETFHVPSVSDEDMVAFATDEQHLMLLRAVGFGSILIVPLVAAGRPLGAITLVREDPARRFSDADRRLAEELGQRAGIAVLNARLYTERVRIAGELQQGLLPPPLPEVSGVATASLYRPAGELEEVGGDFYDAFSTPRGWMVLIGDVAGQGARAAALTALARFTLRSVGQLTGDPLTAVERANRTLREQREMSLCTLACLLIHPDGDDLALTVVCAGHPLPLLVRDGRVEPIRGHGSLAGAFDDASWPVTTVPLRSGDSIVLYTDGVLDTVGASERFGEARLLDLLSGAAGPAQQMVDRVESALRAFQAGPHGDDTAVVVVSIEDRDAALAAVRDGAGAEPGRR